jgi:uncharacterized protein (DUF58 family)
LSSTASQPKPPTHRAGMDPATLMRIRSLAVRAKVIVEGFWRGIHRSPYHGFSVEFTEYREYVPGDDTRYLDWRLYARSDRFYIKKYEDETNLRCLLLVDRSRSMAYGSLGYTKADYATTVAASLARLLFGQGDAVGLVTFDQTVNDYLPPRNRPGHLKRLTGMLEHVPDGRDTNLSEPLQHVAQMARRRGLLILLTDLLAPIDHLRRDLGLLRARGHEVVVFQFLDPTESSFDFSTPTRFEDMETGRDLYIDPALAAETYRQRLDAHIGEANAACAEVGADTYRFTTDEPIEVALLAYLKSRAARARGRQRA